MWPFGNQVVKKHEKKERPAPVIPSKDVTEVTGRFERRMRAVENLLQAAQGDLKEKLDQIDQLKVTINGLEQQIVQEKSWRQKEEASVVKERQQEQGLRLELDKTRALLDGESTLRIRQDYELKELRLIKENTTAEVRKLTGFNHELERRVKELEAELRVIKSENDRLKVKKEADAWVAKDDFVKVEKLLKRARWEVDQLQQRLPAEWRDVDKMQ
ncbi:MAG: hypothetical protein V2A70_03570 [Candidatus Omnitrophota bacterium]